MRDDVVLRCALPLGQGLGRSDDSTNSVKTLKDNSSSVMQHNRRDPMFFCGYFGVTFLSGGSLVAQFTR